MRNTLENRLTSKGPRLHNEIAYNDWNTDSNIQGILMGNQKRQEKNNVWSVKQNHNRKGGNHKIKPGKKIKITLKVYRM